MIYLAYGVAIVGVFVMGAVFVKVICSFGEEFNYLNSKTSV